MTVRKGNNFKLINKKKKVSKQLYYKPLSSDGTIFEWLNIFNASYHLPTTGKQQTVVLK